MPVCSKILFKTWRANLQRSKTKLSVTESARLSDPESSLNPTPESCDVVAPSKCWGQNNYAGGMRRFSYSLVYPWKHSPTTSFYFSLDFKKTVKPQ
jgi:hypothetical protein